MKGFALYHGRKCVEIAMSRDHLLYIAWDMNDGSPNAPTRFLPCDIARLEAAGYKIRPIYFNKLAEDSQQKGRKK